MEYKEASMNYSRKQVYSSIEHLERRIEHARESSGAALFRTNFGEEAGQKLHEAHQGFREVDALLYKALQKLSEIRQNF